MQRRSDSESKCCPEEASVAQARAGTANLAELAFGLLRQSNPADAAAPAGVSAPPGTESPRPVTDISDLIDALQDFAEFRESDSSVVQAALPKAGLFVAMR